jgi:hypothetical protein
MNETDLANWDAGFDKPILSRDGKELSSCVGLEAKLYTFGRARELATPLRGSGDANVKHSVA